MNISGQSFLPWFVCEKSGRNSRVSISLEPHEFSWRCTFPLVRDILHCSLWNCWTVYSSCLLFKHQLFKSIREYIMLSNFENVYLGKFSVYKWSNVVSPILPPSFHQKRGAIEEGNLWKMDCLVSNHSKLIAIALCPLSNHSKLIAVLKKYELL